MIVGFSIKRLNAEKHSGKRGEFNINYHSSITDVEEADVPAIDDPIARISFELGVSYQLEDGDEEVATLDFEGTVLWQKDADDVLSHWDEEGTLEENVRAAVTNHLFRKCLTQAVGLADALELPSPVPMPRVAQQ